MKNTITSQFALACMLALAVTSCAPTPTPLPLPTITLPVPTAILTLAPPTEPVTPIVASTDTTSQCPINPDQVSIIQDRMVVKPSEHDGWCEVSLPLNSYTTIGYSLRYPTGWVVTLAGAEGMNLRFDAKASSGKDQEVFIQLASTNSSLEQADKATYGFEMAGPDPLVGEDESELSRATQAIGDKQVLVLITSKNDLSIKRYFTLHSGTLYMFEIETLSVNFGDSESTELFVQVEEMISSMRFAR